MPEEKAVLLEKTFNMCQQTRRLIEKLEDELKIRRAHLAGWEAYNEAAAAFLETAMPNSAHNHCHKHAQG
jgi:hypothetical protein